jgi:ECF sigma factor
VTVDLARSRGADKRGGGAVCVAFGEAAAIPQTPSRTVPRDWEFARAWLRRELTGEAGRDT